MNDEANTITDRSEKRAPIARIAALREFKRWRANTLLQLGINPAAVADDEALEAPPGDMAQKENDGMTDELYTRTESSVRYWTRGELLIRAERAETKLTTLKELVRWRPVSERPPNDAPVLALLESGEYKVVRYVDKVGGVTLRYWRGTGGPDEHVAHWRPITEEAPAE